MNRWQKIIISASLIIIAVTGTAYLIVKMAHFQIQAVITDNLQRHLSIVRDHKKQQVEKYFQHLKQQLQLYAHLPIIIEAMRELQPAVSNFRSELAIKPISSAQQAFFRTALLDYYAKQDESNNAALSHLAALLEKLDEHSLALQYHLFIKPFDFSHLSYLQLHRKYHRLLKRLQTDIPMAGLLLLEASEGKIVYATSQNIALDTSLITGIFSHAALGETLRQLATVPQAKGVMVDFFPYLPAFDAPTAFLATPIFDGEQKLGFLVFQLHYQALNAIMTDNYSWSLDDVGNTGETYLIGADGTMRNDSRFLIEEPEDYLSRLHQRGLPQTIITNIARKKTSVGLQPVTTVGAKAALAGITGFELYEEYHDRFVFSAYAPVTVMGFSWAILATLPEPEALLLLEEITTLLTYGAIQIAGGIIFLALIGLIMLGLTICRSNEQSTTAVKTYSIEEIINHLNQLR